MRTLDVVDDELEPLDGAGLRVRQPLPDRDRGRRALGRQLPEADLGGWEVGLTTGGVTGSGPSTWIASGRWSELDMKDG